MELKASTSLFCQRPGEEQKEYQVTILYDDEKDKNTPITELFRKYAEDNQLGHLNGIGFLDFST